MKSLYSFSLGIAVMTFFNASPAKPDASDHYPLGSGETERQRLQLQAEIVQTPGLDSLIRPAKRILEIGCGSGSKVPMVRQLNPEADYLGVDFDSEAIAFNRQTFGDDRTQFLQADITGELTETGPSGEKIHGQYDLIFAHLVFWSVGPEWKNALKQLRSRLSPEGTLYLLEPDDEFFLKFLPPKPHLQQAIEAFQNNMAQQGRHPSIGRELHPALIEAGYVQVRPRIQVNVVSGDFPEAYQSCARNLEGIFLGQGPKNSSEQPFPLSPETWHSARQELRTFTREDSINEGFYIVTAKRGLLR